MIRLSKIKRPETIIQRGGIINVSYISQLAEDYLDAVADKDNDKDPQDTKDYIFEAVMEAIYGGTVWEYIRKVQK